MKEFSFLKEKIGAASRIFGNLFAASVSAFVLSLSLSACLDPVGKMDDTVIGTIDKKFVLPPIVSPASTVFPTSVALLADGVTTASITVTLVDATSSAPISGKTVSLTSSRSGSLDTISAASGPSSSTGQVMFTVTSITPGSAIFTANDSTDSIAILSTATVAWVSNASALNWTQGTATRATTVTATWIKSAEVGLSDQKIQFYSGSTCNTPSGALIDLASGSTQSKTFTPGDGTYSFKITSYDPKGNPATSSCSPGIIIDTSNVTSWSMGSISSGTTSCNSTPSISGNHTTNGFIVKLYSDAGCSSPLGAQQSVASGTFSISGYTSTVGVNSYWYTIQDSQAHGAATCISTALTYTYNTTPLVYFSQMGYSVKEFDGTNPAVQVGTPVTVSRSFGGCTTNFTLTSSDVTAFSGTDYTAGNVNGTISGISTSSTVPASSFGIVHNSAVTGDLFFQIKLTGVTTGTIQTAAQIAANQSATNQIAQVNILDYENAGDFMFNQPLYTIKENAGNATLTIQRGGNTGSSATVHVSLVDGTAVAGSDYTGTTQTVNFASGIDEATITVPIADNAAKDDNKSFIVKLVNNSAGTQMRNISIAKVRILNDDGDTNACDATNANNGVNNGFGGGTGAVATPYLICSLYQLKRVTSFATSYHKVMADIIADNTMTPIATYTGNFDGYESIVYDFSYNANAGANQIGFFSKAITSANYIRGLNLLNLSVVNTTSTGGYYTGGLLGIGSPILSNNLVSGYLNATNPGSGLLLGMTNASSNLTYTISNGLTFGKSVNAGGDAGGAIGYLYVGSGIPTYNLSGIYNMANVSSPSAYTGGVIGNNQGGGTYTMINFENRGTVSGTNSVGGVIGIDEPYNSQSPTGTLSYAVNYGNVFGTSNTVGGVVGKSMNYNSFTFTNPINYGNVSATSSVGGVIGYLAPNTASSSTTVSGAINTGTVTGSSSAVAGIVGYISVTGAVTGISVSVDSSSNSGTVSGTHYVGGVIGYEASFTTGAAPTNNTFSITNSSNTGNVSGSDSTGCIGGLMGYYGSNLSADAAFTFTSNTNTTGTITCTAGPNCGGLIGELNLAGTKTNTVSNSSSTSAINGGSQVGGLIGYSGQSSGATTLNISNSFATGSLASTSYSGGLIGYYLNYTGTSLLTNSHSQVVVTSTGNDNGGLIGGLYAGGSVSTIIKNSYSTGAVSGVSINGGLIGYLVNVNGVTSDTVTIQDAYATGSVTSSTSNTGGIVGEINYASGTITVNLTRLYTTSIISGASIVGGLYGQKFAATVNVTNSYWLQDTGLNAGLATDGNQRGVIALTGGSANYTGWTFDSVNGPWMGFTPGQYPTLK